MPDQRRIAVVGSGVAGLTAAYVASRTADVTLYEADDRLGGHADTHLVRTPDGDWRSTPVSSSPTRRPTPTLLRIFAELGIETQPSEMSMSITDDDTDVECAGALGAGRALRPALLPPVARRLADAARDPAVPPSGRAVPRRRGLGSDGTKHSIFSPKGDSPGSSGTSSSRWSRPSGPVTRRRRSTTRALPLHVPRARRHARRLRLAGVAHGHRRLRDVRRRGRRRARGVRLRAEVTSVRELADGVEITDGSGTTPPSTRSSLRPSRPRARMFDRRRRSARGPRRAPLQQQPGPPAHRRLAPARGARRASVVELPPPRKRERAGHR